MFEAAYRLHACLCSLGLEVSRSLLCESFAACICIHFPWGGWLCVWCSCGWGGGCGTCVTTSSCLVPCRLARVIDLGGRLLPRELSRAADRQQCLICILLNRFTNLPSIVPLLALLKKFSYYIIPIKLLYYANSVKQMSDS